MCSRAGLFLIVTILNLINGQNDNSFIPSGYEEVTKKTDESLGALDKCGEGATAGTHKCVSYYLCDRRTNTIVQTEQKGGFGVIDVRIGVNDCPHPLDVCCKIPQTPLPPEPTTEAPQFENVCGIRNTNGIDFKLSMNKENFAEYGEFPWMVAILDKNYVPDVSKTLAVCGGSLIAANVVLTGAHCVHKYTSEALKIRAGEWDTQTEKERLPYQERDVAEIIIHPAFNPGTLFNDFALLILKDPVKFDQHIGTICLPTPNQIIDSQECYATGWGKDVFGREGAFQVILKKIELPIVEHSKCELALRETRLGKFFKLDDSFTCAGGQFNKDTCTGDGGSPLVCPDPTNPHKYVQAGIVAWGIGCGEDGVPGVYADVAKFRPWIDEQFKRLNIDTNPHVA